uniref:Uncharacterized protein n=1 Tax=Kwoniella bestiolae CBS 10118 TaxID=1296100 RepID=A0A1B9GG94_9TREE|nr:hypothetical protein I302_01601 [Kwoniella bestiolae CBS 10118]OCF30082.1 hypothetical protein I302_01601 [Kwoniella bestiolae CBS 10118]
MSFAAMIEETNISNSSTLRSDERSRYQLDSSGPLSVEQQERLEGIKRAFEAPNSQSVLATVSGGSSLSPYEDQEDIFYPPHEDITISDEFFIHMATPGASHLYTMSGGEATHLSDGESDDDDRVDRPGMPHHTSSGLRVATRQTYEDNTSHLGIIADMETFRKRAYNLSQLADESQKTSSECLSLLNKVLNPQTSTAISVSS